MPPVTVVLDDAARAVLDQLLVGLTPPHDLPAADVYLDEEGTPVAHREAGRLVADAELSWPVPSATAVALRTVVAVDGAQPAQPLPPGTLVLLALGGIRPDDRRCSAWVGAWSPPGTSVVPVPVPPAQAAARADELAAAYSSGPRVDISTTPLPATGGTTVLLTGLSGSGKSTIAREVTRRLAAQRTVTLLDGDIVRTHLSRGLGFSREDRDLNIRRIGWVAAEVTKHGGVAVCAPIAPYDATRRWVRARVEEAGGDGSFRLVHVATPLEVCEARDTKGLYARARAGELTGFTGVDDPYEPPADADLVLDTSRQALDECVTAVLGLVRER